MPNVAIATTVDAIGGLVHAEPPGVRRKTWTRAEVADILAKGGFAGQKLELIEGELIDKMGKLWGHVRIVKSLVSWLNRIFGDDYVGFEGSIDVSPEDNPTNEPEPDIAVFSKTLEHYAETQTRPVPKEIRLVIEVADSTLAFDRKVKAGLYARARIADYWVLDAKGRMLIVHRRPIKGTYRDVVEYGEHDPVAPLAAPHSDFRVADLRIPRTR